MPILFNLSFPLDTPKISCEEFLKNGQIRHWTDRFILNVV